MPETSESRWIPLGQIVLPPDARPHDPESLAALTEDMRKNGQLQEIIVMPMDSGAVQSPKSNVQGQDEGEGADIGPGTLDLGLKFLVVAGVGRTLAARKLGWERIRAFVREVGSEFERLHITFSENEAREDVRPLYQAYLVKRMLETEQISQEKLADKIGMSRGTISQYVMVSSLDREVQEVANRLANLKLAHFLQLCRLSNPDQQIQLAEMAAKQGWSVRELEAKVHAVLGGKPRRQILRGGLASVLELMKTMRRHRDEAPDPLREHWTLLRRDRTLDKIEWEVQFKDGRWLFSVQDNPKTTPATLICWFRTVACALDTELRIALEAAGSDAAALAAPPVISAAPSPLRLPQTRAEEAELDALAKAGDAFPVYAWIYGQDSFTARSVKGAKLTDLDPSIKDPVAAIRDLVRQLKAGA